MKHVLLFIAMLSCASVSGQENLDSLPSSRIKEMLLGNWFLHKQEFVRTGKVIEFNNTKDVISFSDNGIGNAVRCISKPTGGIVHMSSFYVSTLSSAISHFGVHNKTTDSIIAFTDSELIFIGLNDDGNKVKYFWYKEENSK